ncbi:BatA domain-containing protein [Halobacteriaceae archaeon GCM10025711]
MAVSDVFLTPVGLLALAAVVPLVVLYLIRPDPARVPIPTLRFLAQADETGGRNRVIDRLRRSLLLLLQLLVLVLVAVSLGSPYVQVSSSAVVQESVLVVDASASMATQADGDTRFDRAVAAARDAVTGTTSVVVADESTTVAVRRGSGTEARQALADLRVTDAGGDLGRAVDQAAAVAGEGARVVVFSDFADESDWQTAVESARARGLRVDLEQFRDGANQAGIVDTRFTRSEVTAAVRNFGDETITREVRLGDQSRRLTLEPGDQSTATLPVPAGGGPLRLSPGDGFPTDDVAYVAAPDRDQIRVLLVTNDENRYLVTALSVLDEVALTVASPPTSVTDEYDVIVFSNVDPDRLLQGTVQSARETVQSGGGVAILAQPDLDRLPYAELLPVDPGPVAEGSSIQVVEDPLTRGIAFPVPGEYVTGDQQGGLALVREEDGTPIVDTITLGPGRTLYYGYIEESSTFKTNYLYPVFWKRAIYFLAGREPLPESNRRTGERLQFPRPTTVETPVGPRTARTLRMDVAGYYEAGGRRVSASLLDASESNVTAAPLERQAGTGPLTLREVEERVPVTLTPLVIFGALGFVVVELVYLKYRGDI